MSEEYILSEEEHKQVEEGEAAASLLDSPIYLLAIERVRAQCAEAILTSGPEKQAERESLYNLSRGLSAVTEELANLAAMATAILDNAARSNNPEPADLVQDDPDQIADY